MATKTNTTTKKSPTVAKTDALQSIRQAIIHARAARADDIDVRDAALSFMFDLWKADMTALTVLRASTEAKHLDVRQAIVWTESRCEKHAEEILKTMPETAAGAEIRAAVLIEHVLPILKAQDVGEFDVLQAIIVALEVRRTELGKAPFADRRRLRDPEAREAELTRAISSIGDILLGNETMTDREAIAAALRVVHQAEVAQ